MFQASYSKNDTDCFFLRRGNTDHFGTEIDISWSLGVCNHWDQTTMQTNASDCSSSIIVTQRRDA